jgi:zinc protease
MPEIRGDVVRAFADMDNNALLALNGERISRLVNQDGRFQRAPIKKIQSYSLDQLRAWLEPQLKSAPLELGAVGDFDVEEMIELARRTIGCLPRRNPWPAPPALKFIDHLSETVELPVASTNRHGAIQVSWALPAEHDHRTERKGELLAAVLGNRLETRIRHDMSATYSPRCNVTRSEFQPESGYLIASLTCGPSDSKRIGEIVEKIADELARTGVTKEELERARQPKLQSVPTLLRQNTTWISLVNVAQSQPEKLELARTRASDLESITVEDLNRLASKILLTSRASLFISTPSQTKP